MCDLMKEEKPLPQPEEEFCTAKFIVSSEEEDLSESEEDYTTVNVASRCCSCVNYVTPNNAILSIT